MESNPEAIIRLKVLSVALSMLMAPRNVAKSACLAMLFSPLLLIIQFTKREIKFQPAFFPFFFLGN